MTSVNPLDQVLHFVTGGSEEIGTLEAAHPEHVAKPSCSPLKRVILG
jgi:hypothetical protein